MAKITFFLGYFGFERFSPYYIIFCDANMKNNLYCNQKGSFFLTEQKGRLNLKDIPSYYDQLYCEPSQLGQ